MCEESSAKGECIIIYNYNYLLLISVPCQPNPPVVGKVTYHSIELSWDYCTGSHL